MTNAQQTALQEIFYDLCDLIDENEDKLSLIKIEGFDEFENLLEFLQEQKTKFEDSNTI